MVTFSLCALLEFSRAFLIATSSVCIVDAVLEVLQHPVKFSEYTAAPVVLVFGSTEPSV